MRIRRNVLKLGFIWTGALILIAGALLSCGDGGGDGGSISRSSFWVLDFTKNYQYDPSAWYQIEVTKKAETARSVVYVDKNETQVTEAIAGVLAQEFENSIYSNVTQHFAQPLDVDGNGKTILVVLDICDGYHPITSPSYIGGYFFSVDLFSKGSIDAYNALYGTVLKTNEGDIVYIDSNPQDTSTEDAWRTVSHEFQHLVNASYSIKNNEDYQDTWIDEGLAEAANHICYDEVTDRIDYYNYYNYTGSPVTNGHPLFYWDTTSHLVNYSLSYLFFQYLRSQSYLKNGIFKEIIESVHGNDGAVKDAMDADSYLSDPANWGSTSDERFNKLLLRWYVTNQNISTITNNLYEYDGEITTIPDAILYNSNSVSLISGGGVVKDMGNPFSNLDPGFIYMSLQSDGMVEDDTDPYVFLDYFVAVRRNYDTSSGSSFPTPLPISTIVEGEDGRDQSIRASSSVMRKPQKVDFILPPDVGKRLRGLR